MLGGVTTTSPVLGRSPPATLSEVVRRFWWPVYGEARSLGHSPEAALKIAAATVGRAADAASFLRAEGHEGRLRLLFRAELRGVLAKPALLDHSPPLPGVSVAIAEARGDYPPGDAFDRRWAIVVQEEALRAVQASFASSSPAETWPRLRPYLAEEIPDAPWSVDGQEFLPADAYRLRQQFRQEIRRAVAETVTTPVALDSELEILFGQP